MAREIDHSRWKRAYLSEIDRYAQMLPGRVLNAVFFGGGTPSLMAPETVASVLSAVRAAWPVSNDLEVTLEANPGSVDSERFRAFAEAGISRVSMGVQALNDHDLRRLGRIHTVKEAREAFEVARMCFDRVSFDLIYARQDQTIKDWKAELREALSMAIDHLSLYQLTIEPGTSFGDRYACGKLKGLPIDETAAEMYETTQEICAYAGLPAYEVSNHAKPGSESRHNLIYWRYGDYIGIGPGAHGRITRHGQRHATEAWAMPERWLNGVDNDTAEKPPIALSGVDQATEYLLMGLRVSEGIDMARYKRLAGQAIDAQALFDLQDIGMVIVNGSRLQATEKGRIVLNSVIGELLREY